MNVKMYYNESDDRAINKSITNETLFQGDLRDSVTIMGPVIRFYSADVLRFNYCYIPDFQRYYHVTSIEAVSLDIYDVSLSVDVLMSFRGDILKLPAIVNKQTERENGNEYIDDSSLVCNNMLFSRTYNYSEGFNNTPAFILITAG